MANTVTMGRGTTPLYTIKFKGITLAEIGDIYITFEQTKSNQELTKHYPEVALGDGYAYVQLTQAETLAFQKGSAKMQIRFLDKMNNAFKSTIVNVQVSDVLYEEEI